MKGFIYWIVKLITVIAMLLFVQSFTKMTNGQVIIFDLIAFIGIDICSWIKTYNKKTL